MFSVRNTQVSVKMSCKFCKDAGKSENEYTNHFLRESKDPNSRITCPTLLAIECRYCFKKGHTVSKCAKLLKEKNGNQKKVNVLNSCKAAYQNVDSPEKAPEGSYRRRMPSAPIKKAWTGNTRVYDVNHFDLLSDFGDSDIEEEVDSNASTCMDCDTSASGSSDGSSAPPKVVQGCDRRSPTENPSKMTYAQMLAKPAVVVVNVPELVGSRISILTKARSMRSWADFSDSDDDE